MHDKQFRRIRNCIDRSNVQRLRPIAFNSFSSISDIIKNESQLVTPFSISEYISKLSCIIDSNELFQKLQDDGYKSSYNFTIETIVDYWEALINKITVWATSNAQYTIYSILSQETATTQNSRNRLQCLIGQYTVFTIYSLSTTGKKLWTNNSAV